MAYSENASKKVFDYITEKVSSGEWIAGMKIATEDQLGKETEVSRVAVRQAIDQLCAIAVLKKMQGSGTYVIPFEETSLVGMQYYPATKESIKAVQEFRCMFEPYCSQLFVKYGTEDDLKAIEECLQKMRDCAEDAKQMDLLDGEFHNLIAAGTHNTVMRRVSGMLVTAVKRHHMPRFDNNMLRWHEMIAEALRNKDEELAYIYTKKHSENVIYVLEGNTLIQP